MLRTTWKLKAGVKLPFAPQDSDANTIAAKAPQLSVSEADISASGKTQLTDSDTAVKKALRPVQCDLYIESRSDIAYLPSLCSFLSSKGISMAPYSDDYTYADTDVVLLCATRPELQCRVFVMSADKVPLWSFLKQNFADRL